MIGGTGGLGSTILNSFTQKAYQQFSKEDTNRSGGLDVDEIQKKVDATGSGQNLLDNFDAIDSDKNGELSATELIADRVKAGEGQDELLNQLQTIFQQSGISTSSIVGFLSEQTSQQSDLSSLLQSSTNLDALIESRVQEILTNYGESSESQLLHSITTV